LRIKFKCLRICGARPIRIIPYTITITAGAVRWAIDSPGASILPTDILGHCSVLPDAQPISKDTVFFLASTTKLVTAVAAMQCVERGLVDLDEPVGER
jgi:hypothetical protein